jgi:predicted short-subunit dehydrogenase-like oxidoreductase (DUF2520 family)
MGGALALALSQAGEPVDEIIYRSRPKTAALVSRQSHKPKLTSFTKVAEITSNVLIIATQDEELAQTAETLASKVRPKTIVFHTSGSISSEILMPFKRIGAETASLHPLASISSAADGPARFRGAFFCIEGSAKAVAVGKRIVKKLGGKAFTIDAAEKPLYHAAALTAAGHVTALFDVAVSLMEKSGLERGIARKVLQPLLLGVAQNLSRYDTSEALTGTFARGDEATLSRHLKALASAASELEYTIYLDLALRSIDLAESNGLDKARASRMRRSIGMAKR